MKSIGVLLVAVIGLAQGAIILEKAQEFECPLPGGAFPHPTLCAHYYECIENVAIPKVCPKDQGFDLVYDGCNWLWLMDCADREPPSDDDTTAHPPVTTTKPPGTGSTHPPPPTTTGSPPGDFECPTPGGAFPHPKLCAWYYVCIENVATLHECPKKQGFDLVYDGCNWLVYMDCDDREPPPDDGTTAHPPVTTTNPPGTGSTHPPPPTTTGSPPGDFECPAADGLFANPDDCSTYYTCSNSIPILSPCPDTLLFDDIHTVCDFPNNVDCGDRPIPQPE